MSATQPGHLPRVVPSSEPHCKSQAHTRLDCTVTPLARRRDHANAPSPPHERCARRMPPHPPARPHASAGDAAASRPARQAQFDPFRLPPSPCPSSSLTVQLRRSSVFRREPQRPTSDGLARPQSRAPPEAATCAANCGPRPSPTCSAPSWTAQRTRAPVEATRTGYLPTPWMAATSLRLSHQMAARRWPSPGTLAAGLQEPPASQCPRHLPLSAAACTLLSASLCSHATNAAERGLCARLSEPTAPSLEPSSSTGHATMAAS